MMRWANNLFDMYNRAYDNAHGGTRVALSHVPIFGWARRLKDDIKKADDYYKNTGEDPLYMSKLGGNVGNSVFGGVGSFVLPRMARSLSKLYPAEIKESCDWNKAIQHQKDSYAHNVENWQKGYETKYKE